MLVDEHRAAHQDRKRQRDDQRDLEQRYGDMPGQGAPFRRSGGRRLLQLLAPLPPPFFLSFAFELGEFNRYGVHG